MLSINVVIVPENHEEDIVFTKVVPSHEMFCALVKDYNTEIAFFDKGAIQTGSSVKLDIKHNRRAHQILEAVHPGFTQTNKISGNAVLFGLDSEENYADVPENVFDKAQSLV